MKTIQLLTLFKYATLLMCLLFVGTGCVVSSSAGRVTITNRSDKAVTNIKIGDRILALYLFPGAEIDYYYILGVRGTLRVEGVDSVTAHDGWRDVEDPTVSLSLGYHYRLTISQDSSNSDEYTAAITRSYQGDSSKDPSSQADWVSD